MIQPCPMQEIFNVLDDCSESSRLQNDAGKNYKNLFPMQAKKSEVTRVINSFGRAVDEEL